MQISLSFLSGVLFFSLYNYLPLSSFIIFISVTVLLISKRKFLLILFIAIGVFYAFFRYHPDEDLSDIWNRELKITGRFTQGGNTNASGRNIQTFLVDTVQDEESGEDLDWMHDKEIRIPADFDVDFDDGYTLLLKTGKDRTRLNPGQPGKGRLYGEILSAEDKGESAASVLAVFARQRDSLNRYISERFSEDSGAFIAAITTGDTLSFNDELRDAFNSTGLVHILSISRYTFWHVFSHALWPVWFFNK